MFCTAFPVPFGALNGIELHAGPTCWAHILLAHEEACRLSGMFRGLPKTCILFAACAHRGVQRPKGLVHEQQARLHGQRARKRDALPLPAAEVLGVAPAHVGQPHQLQQLAHPVLGFWECGFRDRDQACVLADHLWWPPLDGIMACAQVALRLTWRFLCMQSKTLAPITTEHKHACKTGAGPRFAMPNSDDGRQCSDFESQIAG